MDEISESWQQTTAGTYDLAVPALGLGWVGVSSWCGRPEAKADADFAKLTQGDSNLHDKLAFGVNPIVKKMWPLSIFGVGKNLRLLWVAAKVQIRTMSYHNEGAETGPSFV